MHEIALVEDIISVINSKLKEMNYASRIRTININIGELEHVSSSHFEFHFRERTKGTVLENVNLNFKKVKAVFRCKDCLHEFSAQDGLFGCPWCKAKLNDVISGYGVYIESIETD